VNTARVGDQIGGDMVMHCTLRDLNSRGFGGRLLFAPLIFFR
jgi:hypothetical protein